MAAETMERRLTEKVGFRVDDLGYAKTLQDGIRIYELAALKALWAECLRLIAQNEWIKVKDKLPEIGKIVLGYWPKTRPTAPYLCIRGEHSWYDEPGEELNEPTHWREITLPEGEKE